MTQVETAPQILVAAGGTAGHVVPALAVADVLRKRGADVVFVGGDRVETELVPAAGYRFHQLSIEGISRSNPLKALWAVCKAGVAIGHAFRILRRERPDVVLGAGGYVAGPFGLAAVVLRIPLVLTEADSHLGLTNRLLAPFARRVCLGFPLKGREGETYRVTGRPVPELRTDRSSARARFGIGLGEKCVLIFGGSLGARSLNQAAVAAFNDIKYRVLHVTGKREFSSIQAEVGSGQPQGDSAQPQQGDSPYVIKGDDHYVVCDYITPFGDALLAADLVVARSGGSVFEIAQYAKGSILIPYPYATGDHQTANARQLEQAGAAVVITDSELNPQLLRQTVDELMGDESRLGVMSSAAREWARPDAADAIADEILSSATPGR